MTPEQLKASILQYAIQGKLVEQKPEEGNAGTLFDTIQEKKRHLIKEKLIAKPKKMDSLENLEPPFDIPSTWKWVRLGMVCNEILVPQRDKPKVFDGDIPWCRIEDIEGKYLNGTKSNQYVSSDTVASMNLKVNPVGTVISANSASVGEAAICAVSCVTNQTFIGLVPSEGLFNEYLYYFLKANASNMKKLGAGTTILYISQDKYWNLPFPLPPLEEQHRIVARIEEILPLVDRYAKAYEKLEQFNSKFPAEMKKSILQYAIMGKLVEQRPEEGTAGELYQQLQEEKERLIKNGKIKREKALESVSADEIPFDIPDSWIWVRFDDVAGFYNGDRGKNYPNKSEYVSEGIAWINTGHILPNGYLDEESMNYITEEKYNSLSGGKIQDGDFVYCLRGATYGKVSRIEPFSVGAIASSLMGIRPVNKSMREYIYLYLKSPLAKHQLLLYENGSAQQNLAAKDVRKFLLPLPPLKEQERIVDCVNSLLPYCERLLK